MYWNNSMIELVSGVSSFLDFYTIYDEFYLGIKIYLLWLLIVRINFSREHIISLTNRSYSEHDADGRWNCHVMNDIGRKRVNCSYFLHLIEELFACRSSVTVKQLYE